MNRLLVMLALAGLCGGGLGAGAAPVSARIVFQTRHEIDLGALPSAAAFAGPDARVLLVSGADGISVFRRANGGLARDGERRAGDAARQVAAGRGLAAYRGQAAADVMVARLDAGGVPGAAATLTLPAATRALRVAPLQAGGPEAVLALHDDGLAVLTPDGDGWHMREAAGLRFGVDIGVGDLDGDGRSDVAIADEGGNAVRLLHGAGDGAFADAGTVATTRAPRRALIADASGDGRSDLLVIGAEGLAMHLGTPDGAYAPARLLWASPHLADAVVADLGGDPLPEILVADRARGTATVLHARGGEAFATGDSYLAGAAPSTLLTGDVDGDGRIDALLLSQLGGGATLLRGAGDGRLDGILCAVGQFGALTAMVADDFNGDDHLDLAAASQDGGSIGIFLGRGDGRFTAQPPIAVGRQPRALTVGDFDQNEHPDLAVVDFAGDAVAILLGDGRGGFTTPSAVGVGGGPTAIGVGSFASPTSSDLAVVNSLSGSVSVLYGDGQGHFPTVTSFPVAARPSFLIIGDTNADGNQDLVVGGALTQAVAILLGTGRALAAPTTSQLEGAARPSLAEDFDRDGNMDLVNPDGVGGAIEVLPGADNGAFGAPQRLVLGRDPQAVATGDFDHDGRADVAVAHRASQTIVILLNQSPRPTPNRRADARPM